MPKRSPASETQQLLIETSSWDFIRRQSLTLNGSSALIFSPGGWRLAGLSLLCLWDAFTLGIVRERADIKPMESAASEWGYYLNSLPLFLFLRKVYLGSAKI